MSDEDERWNRFWQKLRENAKEPKYDYLYKCLRCGKETWYVIELPAHMLRHEGASLLPYDYRRFYCNGNLSFKEKRLRVSDEH